MTYEPSPDEMAVRRFEHAIRKVRALPIVVSVGAAANDNIPEPDGLYVRVQNSSAAIAFDFENEE